MNKIINSSKTIITDMIDGYLAISGDKFKKVDNTFGGIVKRNQKEKVAIVIGGGAGNEPWCLGYVGDGLADGVSTGHVYVAPPAISILDVTKAVYNKKGVLFIANNHMGDVLNFELVKELAILENIDTRCVFLNDDIASDLKNIQNRRGVSGISILVKMAGAASEFLLSIDEVERIARETNDNLRTIGVTTSQGYFPANGKAMFELEDGMIEYGMGFNGEPGIIKENITSAKNIVKKMLDLLFDDMKINNNEKIAVLLNGYGFISTLELCIVLKEIKDYIDNANINLHHLDLQQLFCPQGTGGFSISVLKLNDELEKFYNYGANAPFYKREEILR